MTSPAYQAILPRFSGLLPRLLSALVLIPLVIWWNVNGGHIFFLVLATLAALMTVEWWRITWRTGFVIALSGFPYILLSTFCLQQMRMIGLKDAPDFGMYLVFFIIGLLAIIDTLAYFTGKSFGKRKLAPSISPNKTREGLYGAMMGAGVYVCIMQSFLPAYVVHFPVWFAFLIGVVLAVLAQLGDLFESWLKRLAGVKDSGGLIPGHGGLLDRADGYLAVIPFVWGWCIWQGWI